MKKNTFRDKLKTWLYTLCIGGFACLLGFGASMTEKYIKASAYEYQENGTFRLNLNNDYDLGLFCSYLYSLYGYDFDENTHYNDITLGFIDEDLDTYDYTSSYYTITDNGNTIDYDFFDDTDYALLTVSYPVVSEETFGKDSTDSLFYLWCLPSFDGYYSLLNYALSYIAPQSTGNFLTALSDFAQLMVGGIIDLGTGIATGITNMASALFLDNGSLGIVGGIIAMFCGLALACGITSKVYTWCTTLGN